MKDIQGMKLINFTIENFKSFLDKQTITFDLDCNNVDIFVGPNNSGKSNIFQAIAFYKSFIQKSTAFESDKEQLEPFAFHIDSKDKPITLSAEMQTKKSVYVYEFSYQGSKVVDETLKRSAISEKKVFKTIFSRPSMDKNRYADFGFDSKLLRSTRDDALVLTKAFENNNKYALEIFDWLSHLRFVSGSPSKRDTARKISEDEEFKGKVLDLLRRADLCIQDLESVKSSLPDEFIDQLPVYKAIRSKLDRTTYEVRTTHMVYDNNGKVVGTKTMSLNSESTGTRRIFELAYPILDTLESGNILYIDEFETHLHPKECEFLIELFKSEEENKNKAQLIINTHNSQLIDLVGRDSVHLAGKNKQEQTVIGSISKKIRADDQSLEKKYYKGLFGAVPNIQ